MFIVMIVILIVVMIVVMIVILVVILIVVIVIMIVIDMGVDGVYLWWCWFESVDILELFLESESIDSDTLRLG